MMNKQNNKPKNSWGGRRPGAGRPRDGVRKGYQSVKQIQVTTAVFYYLKNLKEANNAKNWSQFFLDLIQKLK